MAREPMVTRTIKATKVKVMCLDIAEGKPFTKEVTLSRTFKDEKRVLKVVSKMLNSDTVKAVHIVDMETSSVLYGMTEQAFMEAANELPPRKVKE